MKSPAVSRHSTISPLSITATRWLIVATDKRSWEMYEDAHPQFPVQSRKQLENFRLRNDIQSTRWLVGNQEQRPMQYGHSDEYSLRLSDAQLRGISP